MDLCYKNTNPKKVRSRIDVSSVHCSHCLLLKPCYPKSKFISSHKWTVLNGKLVSQRECIAIIFPLWTAPFFIRLYILTDFWTSTPHVSEKNILVGTTRAYVVINHSLLVLMPLCRTRNRHTEGWTGNAQIFGFIRALNEPLRNNKTHVSGCVFWLPFKKSEQCHAKTCPKALVAVLPK